MLKEKVRAYFSFTRKERIGVMVLTGTILCIFILPYFIKNSAPPADPKVFAQFASEIASLKQKPEADSFSVHERSGYQPYEKFQKKEAPVFQNAEAHVHGRLFYFDPNTISPQQWQELGLREKTVQTILHYLSRGGKFRDAQGLQKIYGLFPDEFKRLSPYVRIEKQEGAKFAIAKKITPADIAHQFRTASYSRKMPPATAIDVNTADSTAFTALPGIGYKLAGRIISFRQKLGGFFSVEQIAETYALPDSTFLKIRDFLKVGDSPVTQIDVNTADEARLKIHPYIRWNLAKAIIQFRNQHGAFKTVDELRQVALVTPEIYRKINPYLKMGTISNK